MEKKFKSIADQFLESCGRITLPQLIDDVSAQLLYRLFVSLPRDDVNLAREYRDFSYRKFARAVNRTALWTGRAPGRRSEDFETVRYMKEPSWQGPCVAFFLREELEPEVEKVLVFSLRGKKQMTFYLSTSSIASL
ncbi:hypothetical protein MMC29_002083 [Sticta canariensis]|nr:hypothetical protein [Sticta canariensis]